LAYIFVKLLFGASGRTANVVKGNYLGVKAGNSGGWGLWGWSKARDFLKRGVKTFALFEIGEGRILVKKGIRTGTFEGRV